MTQSALTVVGLGLEAIGLFAAATGLWRSRTTYNGGHTEPHWTWMGLALAGVGLLVQLFDLLV